MARLCKYPGPVRYPVGTPYQGPVGNYDDQINADAFLRRVAYKARPAPLLAHRQRRNSAFYGRLIEELANAHAVLVKECSSPSTAAHCATVLRREIATELYEVAVREDVEHRPGEIVWLVVVYNRVIMQLHEPGWMSHLPGQPDWVGMKEVARVLGVTQGHASRLVSGSGCECRRVGGRNEIMIHRRELSAMANRRGRWRRRTRKAA